MKPQVNGLVSVIIPVRNRPVLVVEAINSALAQTHRPIEILVVDDGSSDDTRHVVRELAAAHPHELRLIEQDALGVATARNRGLSEASGEFVQFLDSDDLLAPEKFARQIAGLRSDTRCGISYCRTREYVLGGRWSGLPARQTGHAMATLFPQLLLGRVWAAPSPLYRRDVIEASGPMEELAIYEDWEYEGRAAARGVRLHHCDEYLADKRDTHHLAGGQKGGTRPHKLKDYAAIHVRMYRYALAAGVAASDLDRFAVKLFAAARVCARDGFDQEARSLIALAADLSLPRLRRWRIAAYRSMSEQFGWRTTAQRITAVEHSTAARTFRGCREWPRAAAARWAHRWSHARRATSGRPVTEWPRLLASGWSARQSRQRFS